MIHERQLLEIALAEDLGLGDITTDSVVDEHQQAVGVLKTREDTIVAGVEVIGEVLRFFSQPIAVDLLKKDGDHIKAGESIAKLTGSARVLLNSERLILNVLRRLCGIASFTHRCVNELQGSDIQICDTRKTSPGLRRLEKLAVRCGGGMNHRFSLADTIMIKDNHIVCAGSIENAITKALARKPHTSKIQVEVDTIDQLKRVIEFPVDLVLLDNMSPKEVQAACDIIPPSIQIEVSGGMTIENLASYSHLPIHRISMGALTGSAPPSDIGVDFEPVSS